MRKTNYQNREGEYGAYERAGREIYGLYYVLGKYGVPEKQADTVGS
jgi:hypothetical protein